MKECRKSQKGLNPAFLFWMILTPSAMRNGIALQYHFHSMNPNEVVNHAYNVLSYIYDNNNPIQNGDHIDGILDGVR